MTTTDAKGIKVARLSHVALQTADLGKQADFYTARWGLDAIDEASREVYLRGDGPDHHVLVLRAEDSGAPGLDHFAFEVADPDDIERAADLLSAQGYAIVTPPTQDLEPGVKKAKPSASRIRMATWWSSWRVWITFPTVTDPAT
jgi:catechol 2,3-dioxygenase-like lactoylglutathione lyase family enzyme